MRARISFGAAQALAMGLLYIAERYLESSLAALVFGSTPFFVAVFAHRMIAGEPLRLKVLASSALGFFGIAVLILTEDAREATAAGLLFALGAAAAAAANKVLGKQLATRMPVFVLLRDMAVVVAVVTGTASLLLERHESIQWTPLAIAAAVYLGLVASTGASGLYLLLLRRIPVTSIAYLQFVTALVGTFAGVFVGGDTLHARHWAGATLVLLGLLLLSARRLRSERSGQPP